MTAGIFQHPCAGRAVCELQPLAKGLHTKHSPRGDTVDSFQGPPGGSRCVKCKWRAGILILLHQNGCLGTPATSAYDPFPSVAPRSALLVNTLKELHRRNVLMGSFNGITSPSAQILRGLCLKLSMVADSGHLPPLAQALAAHCSLPSWPWGESS